MDHAREPMTRAGAGCVRVTMGSCRGLSRIPVRRVMKVLKVMQAGILIINLRRISPLPPNLFL
jgi:hypothetical protein